MIDLEQIAANLIAELVYDITDIDTLRDAANERIYDAADNACIYYSDCVDIIRHYESDDRADVSSADDMGTTYKPSEYREAMTAYAYGIAHGVIAAETSSLIDQITAAVDDLTDALAEQSTIGFDVSEADYRLTADCPHGWAAHDFESENGGCFWISRQLDGCNAIAIPVGSVWISHTWNPQH